MREVLAKMREMSQNAGFPARLRDGWFLSWHLTFGDIPILFFPGLRQRSNRVSAESMPAKYFWFVDLRCVVIFSNVLVYIYTAWNYYVESKRHNKLIWIVLSATLTVPWALMTSETNSNTGSSVNISVSSETWWSSENGRRWLLQDQ